MSLNYTQGDNIREKNIAFLPLSGYCQFYSLKNHSKSYRPVKVNVIEGYYNQSRTNGPINAHLTIPQV